MKNTGIWLLSAALLCGCTYAERKEYTPAEDIETVPPEEPVPTVLQYEGNLISFTMPLTSEWEMEETEDEHGTPVTAFRNSSLPDYHFSVMEFEYMGFCGNGLYYEPLELSGTVQGAAYQYLDSRPLYMSMMLVLHKNTEPSHPVCVLFVDKEGFYDETETELLIEDWHTVKPVLTEFLNHAELDYIGRE